MVHGNLRGVRNRLKIHLAIILTPRQTNIIVDDSGCPRITDFSLVMVVPDRDPVWSDGGEWGRMAARWTAPEILDGLVAYGQKGDVFAFAMVMVEVRYSGHSLRLACWPTSPSRRRSSRTSAHPMLPRLMQLCLPCCVGSDRNGQRTQISRTSCGH